MKNIALHKQQIIELFKKTQIQSLNTAYNNFLQAYGESIGEDYFVRLIGTLWGEGMLLSMDDEGEEWQINWPTVHSVELQRARRFQSGK